MVRQKHPPVIVTEPWAIDLQKVGKMTKTWVTRRYVFLNHVMYIFDKKTDHLPKHVVYLRGLYFKKIYDKGRMYGVYLYGEGDRFKSRRIYHRDPVIMDKLLRHLSTHCNSYSPAEVYE